MPYFSDAKVDMEVIDVKLGVGRIAVVDDNSIFVMFPKIEQNKGVITTFCSYNLDGYPIDNNGNPITNKQTLFWKKD